MSAFDQDFATHAAPMLLEALGDDVYVTPVGGDRQPVTAIVRGPEEIDVDSEEGRKRKHVASVTVARTASAAGGGPYLAEPAVGDVWELGGVSFACEALESQSPAFATLRLVRVAPHEVTRPGYRLKR